MMEDKQGGGTYARLRCLRARGERCLFSIAAGRACNRICMLVGDLEIVVCFKAEMPDLIACGLGAHM